MGILSFILRYAQKGLELSNANVRWAFACRRSRRRQHLNFCPVGRNVTSPFRCTRSCAAQIGIRIERALSKQDNPAKNNRLREFNTHTSGFCSSIPSIKASYVVFSAFLIACNWVAWICCVQRSIFTRHSRVISQPSI